MRRTLFMLHAFGESEQKPAPSRYIELWSSWPNPLLCKHFVC